MTRSGFFVTGYRAHEGETILSSHDTSDEAVASLPETYSVSLLEGLTALLTTYDEYLIYDVRDVGTPRTFRWNSGYAHQQTTHKLEEVIE